MSASTVLGTWTALAVAVMCVPAVLRLVALTSRDPTTELLDVVTVASVAIGTTWVAAARPLPQAVVLIPLAVAGSAAAIVDAREGRLPDVLTLSLLPITLAAVLTTGGDFGAATIGAILGGCVAVVLKAWATAMIGWGDVKLVPTLAVVLSQGGSAATAGVYVAVLVTVTALIVRALDGPPSGSGGLVPYGPALVFGTLGAAAGL
ncbi:MAG: prepilin peptidase [Deltaproteobacteria bacterium]|nr:prepilin peptidase [Deltaproteobacteria bacterium]